jgi:hypothetical protein
VVSAPTAQIARRGVSGGSPDQHKRRRVGSGAIGQPQPGYGHRRQWPSAQIQPPPCLTQ